MFIDPQLCDHVLGIMDRDEALDPLFPECSSREIDTCCQTAMSGWFCNVTAQKLLVYRFYHVFTGKLVRLILPNNR